MNCPDCLELGNKLRMRVIDGLDAIYTHTDEVHQCPCCYKENAIECDEDDSAYEYIMGEYEKEE
jgi:hypothetical protein